MWLCAENRSEFLEKLQRVRGQVKTGTASQPILSKCGQTRLTIGNWTLMCKKDGELQIQNSDGQQVIFFYIILYILIFFACIILFVRICRCQDKTVLPTVNFLLISDIMLSLLFCCSQLSLLSSGISCE